MAEKNLHHLSSLCAEILKLSKVQPTERVAVVAPDLYEQRYLEAWEVALLTLDTDFFVLTLPPQAEGKLSVLRRSQFIYDVLKSADFVLTVSLFPYTLDAPNPMLLIYASDDGREVLASGTRALSVSIDEATMRRLFPTPALIERGFAGAELMEKAEVIRITSEAGTDLVLNKKGRPGATEVGVAHEPGRWDNFGYGLVACAPLEDSASGTMVIDVGDFLMHPCVEVIDPIKLTLEGGRIVRIEGGWSARFLERWLAQWNDERSYIVAHIGWGIHDGARWYVRRRSFYAYFMERYSYYGNMTIAFGSNLLRSPAEYCGIHGENDALSHIDIPCLSHSFYLDDELIIDKGQIVHPDCK